MLSIVLKESLFDPSTGRAPWNKMTQQESVVTHYILESTGSEIGSLPIIPLQRTAASVSGQPGVPFGANAVRTISIRRYQPVQVDDVYWKAQTTISGSVNLIGRISEAISQGILSVKLSTATDPNADMTAKEFYNYMLGV